jgi:hypothetical protein
LGQHATVSEQDKMAQLVATCEQLRAEIEAVLGQIAEIRTQAERSLELANDFELKRGKERQGVMNERR